MFKERLQILPIYPFPKTEPFHSFLTAAQKMIEDIIPESCLMDNKPFLTSLHQSMPILRHDLVLLEPQGVSINLLCYGEFSHGVGRYLTDLFNRWIVPGKRFNADGNLSLGFRFLHYPERRFFFFHKFFSLSQAGDLSIALTTLPRLIKEARLNLLAVSQARSIFSMKSLISDSKRLIQENISSLLSLPYSELNKTMHDHMQSLIFKLSEEEKLSQIKSNIANLKHYQPKNFESVLFHEMTGYTAHYFREDFATQRDSRLLSRIIALHYLFKKLLLRLIYNKPRERHIRIKVFFISRHENWMNKVFYALFQYRRKLFP